ncbi:hypothetical protein D3C80_1026690 [compost metagenome]
MWMSHGLVSRGTPGPTHKWATYRCTTCGGVVLAKGAPNASDESPQVIDVFPKRQTVHEDTPPIAARYLQQAIDTIHAPDASAVMSGAAVDAMLKELGLEKGSVYQRIDEAVAQGKLTQNMAEWAHQVRLGSNRPRHADKENPHVSEAEAKQSLDFATALVHFLFILSAQVARDTAAAKKANESLPEA